MHLFKTLICFIRTQGGYTRHDTYFPLESVSLVVLGEFSQLGNDGRPEFKIKPGHYNFEMYQHPTNRQQISESFEKFWITFQRVGKLLKCKHITLLAHNPRHTLDVLQQHGLILEDPFVIVSMAQWFKKLYRETDMEKIKVSALAARYHLPTLKNIAVEDNHIFMLCVQHAYMEHVLKTSSVKKLRDEMGEIGEDKLWIQLCTSFEFINTINPELSSMPTAEMNQLSIEETKHSTKIKEYVRANGYVNITTATRVKYQISDRIFDPNIIRWGFTGITLNRLENDKWIVVTKKDFKQQIVNSILEYAKRERSKVL